MIAPRRPAASAACKVTVAALVVALGPTWLPFALPGCSDGATPICGDGGAQCAPEPPPPLDAQSGDGGVDDDAG